jgi:ubiquinone/menaquinone biosynthesis C-methylase UbiE
MDSYTSEAMKYMDTWFRREVYKPHSGNQHIGEGQRGHLSKLGMTGKICSVLAGLEFENLLDVGSCDGFNAAFIQRFFGKPVVASDLSSEALNRAYEQYGLTTIAFDGQLIPFENDSFDVVTCNEVIEHLHDPLATLVELYRVARKYVVVSTLEFSPNALIRFLQIRMLNPDYEHAHYTMFTLSDFKEVFGKKIAAFPQLQDVNWVSPFEINDRGMSQEAVQDILEEMISIDSFGYRNYGVILVIPKADVSISLKPSQYTRMIVKSLLNPLVVSHQSEGIDHFIGRLRCCDCQSINVERHAWDRLYCLSCGQKYEFNGPTLKMYSRRHMDVLANQDEAFARQYTRIDFRTVWQIREKINRLPRTSSKAVQLTARLAVAAINFCLHPLDFAHYQRAKWANVKDQKN